MFPPQYYGTTFNVQYTAVPSQKTPVQCHVITSQDSFDIISRNWTDSIAKFSVTDVEKVEIRGDAVVVSMREGALVKSISLETRPEKRETLQKALTEVASVPKAEIRFLALAAILPTFKFADKAQTMNLHKAIMDRTTQFVQTFQASKSVTPLSGPFVDVFTCLYRFRFDNDAGQAVDQGVAAIDLLIRRHMLRTWCERLSMCAQSTGPNAKVYVTKLAGHIMNTITKISNSLSVNNETLGREVSSFVNGEGGDGIAPAAAAIVSQMNDLMKQDLENPFDEANMKLFLDYAMVILCGVVVGLYKQDLERFAARAVEYTRSVVTRGDFESAKQKLVSAKKEFMSELLCFLDGKRYEDSFQYVYCIWEMSE